MPRTVLIVDDSKADCEILSGILKQKYNIISASGGKQMLSLLEERAKSISAILLDIIMPDMDGYEALKIIRNNEIYRQIPVVVVTSLKDENSQVRAMSLGANGYTFKPYNKALLLYLLENTIDLCEKSAYVNSYIKDALTGLDSREIFLENAHRMIHEKEPGYYILSCLDVENFKVINDQYGTQKGDMALTKIAKYINKAMFSAGGICCRYMADKFGLLYPAKHKNSELIKSVSENISSIKLTGRSIRIRIGRYLADDCSISVASMFDRATMAEESVKGHYNVYIAEYNSSMRDVIMREQQIVGNMSKALKDGEFEPWFQPQYNHATGELIGAEALVRWQSGDTFISPSEFIPVFERNGFIYEMDQYIWDKVCSLMRKWIDSGFSPLPVSINISRRDLFHKHFIEVLTGIVEKYNLPYELIRLEVTESAFCESSGHIIENVDKLIKLGFTVEIDDFGSGYSSLNTLKDVPASILKIDVKFFEQSKNSQRSGNIIESVVRMAKWLGMSIIAEGVEDIVQADYLKSIGCYYIQGFLYSKPVRVSEYEKLLLSSKKEANLASLQTVNNLDNNEFWNPRSMETLIFNSYVGGACIFEYYNKTTELIRANDDYIKQLNGLIPVGTQLRDSSIVKFLDYDNKVVALKNIYRSIKTRRESTCELVLKNNLQTEYIRMTLKTLANTGERYLLYGVINNITKQRIAEKKQIESNEQLKVIMDNINTAVSAISIIKGNPEYIVINNKFVSMHGFTEKKEFINADAGKYLCIYPDDRENVENQFKNHFTNGESYTVKYRIVRRDNGQIRFIQNKVSVIKISGIDYPVYLSMAEDIT